MSVEILHTEGHSVCAQPGCGLPITLVGVWAADPVWMHDGDVLVAACPGSPVATPIAGAES